MLNNLDLQEKRFMQTADTIQPATTAEYLLLLEPTATITEQIVREKTYFAEHYKAPEAIRSRPHITLVNFVQYRGAEERIRLKLRAKAFEWAPFMVELAGFDSFPAHTIYCNLVSRNPIQSLVKSIRTDTQYLMRQDKTHKPHFILQPHITIARKLKPWQYEAGWKEYRTRDFSGKFLAQEMVLLRRSAPAGPYKMVERFYFRNQPLIPRQSSLF